MNGSSVAFTPGQIHRYYQQHFPKLQPSRKGECFALCPFHKDRNPSLSVNLNTGLWYCHGCRVGGDLVTFEQRMHGGDHSETWKRVREFLGLPARALPAEPVALYDYTDAQGNLLYQVVRSPGKKFWQRRPGSAGAWINDLKGVTRVPYRLPELLKAAQVFIVEGEKDVETLRALGLVATTNSGGAGKWPLEFAAYLRGKDTVVLPDNDQLGRQHAQQVAESLHGVARSLRVVSLPGLAEKGDVSDWLAPGAKHTKEEFLHLVERAPEWKPEAGARQPEVSRRARPPRKEAARGHAADLKLPDGRHAEIVASPEGAGSRFCIFTPGKREVAFLERIEMGGRILEPAASDLVKQHGVVLARQPEFYESDLGSLFPDLCTFMHTWFLAEPPVVLIGALYALLTWRVHMLSEVPYLRVLGEAGTGKSRFLRTLAELCYRAIPTVGDITEAALFRVVELVPDATFVVDEADRRTATDDPVTQLLRAGTERGRSIFRMEPAASGQGYEPRAYPCFGPKLLAAARPFRDDALESRIFTFSLPRRDMRAATPFLVAATLHQEGARLRNRLFAWHIATYGESFVFEDHVSRTAERLRQAGREPRAIQIGAALLALAEELGHQQALEACERLIQEHSSEITETRAQSRDGVILDVLQRYRQTGQTELTLSTLHRAVCDEGNERGLSQKRPDGTFQDLIRPDILSRLLRKQQARFGVRVDLRLSGRDQTTIHVLLS